MFVLLYKNKFLIGGDRNNHGNVCGVPEKVVIKDFAVRELNCILADFKPFVVEGEFGREGFPFLHEVIVADGGFTLG